MKIVYITSDTWRGYSDKPPAISMEPETYEDVSNNVETMVNHVLKNASSGSIILLHVMGSKNSIARESLPIIIRELKAKGYRFVQLPELLEINI